MADTELKDKEKDIKDTSDLADLQEKGTDSITSGTAGSDDVGTDNEDSSVNEGTSSWQVDVVHQEDGAASMEEIPLKYSDNPEIKRILRLEVPVIVVLAEKTMKLGEVLDFTPGTIIEFEKNVEEELDLMINNKCVGKGAAVKVGENFGIKVTNIDTIEKLIRAMGGEDE